MWLVLWLLFVAVLLVVPLSYGWGYRRWGPPPYHGYVRRKRSPRGEPIMYEETDNWGVVADVVWISLAVALLWLVVAWLV